MQPNEIDFKVCTKCHESKPLSAFDKKSKSRGGLQASCRACSKEYVAKRRAEKPEVFKAIREKSYALYAEKYRAASKRWAENNPDRVKANREKQKLANPNASSIWRNKNKEKARDYALAWTRRNAEKHKERTAKWALENPEIVRAMSAKWRLKNKDKLSVYRQNRRALVKGAGGVLSKDLRQRLFKLQRGKCACCGELLGDNYHLDHIMPLSLGGQNIDDNIQLLRSTCNQQKHAKHPVDFMRQRGFLL